MKEEILPRTEKEYSMPTIVYFGRGVVGEIADLPEILKFKNILLVCGGHFIQSGVFTELKQNLSRNGAEVLVYEGKIAKSDFETVNELTDYCRSNAPEFVIAVGGGTILDTAKCAAVLATNEGEVEDYLVSKNRQLKSKSIPFLAVPTTSGTGSEVTPWAVVWDYENHEKYSLSSLLMFPFMALVDPSLTDELPAKVTAETGMDALTQAIEAYWSKFHNPVSDEYALKSIRLVMDNLALAVNSPTPESRDHMAKASLFAGLAFSNTKTTICHSVSYPITIHWGVAHGQAVSVTLPAFIRYSLSAMEGREKPLLEALKAENIETAARNIETLMKSINLATKLSELGIREEDISTIVKEGYNPDRANNAPRIPTPNELKNILEEIL